MGENRIDLSELLGRFGVAAPETSDAIEAAVIGVCAAEGLTGVEVRQRWGKVTVVCGPAVAERAVRAKGRMLDAALGAGEVSELTVRVRPEKGTAW